MLLATIWWMRKHLSKEIQITLKKATKALKVVKKTPSMTSQSQSASPRHSKNSLKRKWQREMLEELWLIHAHQVNSTKMAQQLARKSSWRGKTLIMEFQLVARRVRVRDHTGTIQIILMQVKGTHLEDLLIVGPKVDRLLTGLPITRLINSRHLCQGASQRLINGSSRWVRSKIKSENKRVLIHRIVVQL